MQLEGKRSPDQIVLMEMLSDEYGWTPSQIRAENWEDIEQYIEIINTKRFIQNGRLKNATNTH